MKFNKWILALTAGIVLLAFSAARAQQVNLTNSPTGTQNLLPPIPAPLAPVAITNTQPTVQGGVQTVINAFESGVSNSYWVPYGLYAHGLKHKFGGGIGWFEPLSTYVVTGVRVDYVDGNFWMPSGNATLQLPLKIASFLTVTPFAYIGVGVPISGAKIVTSLGSVTVPGKVTDNNGDATAITGTGAAILIYQTSDGSRQFEAVGDVEKWTGFSGNQYRLGIAYHSNAAGLFGIGLKIGSIQL